MSGSCNDCGNVMCVCSSGNTPNNRFKVGQWVVSKENAFKIDSIRVFGDHFGYSGEAIDGWFDENDLILADTEFLSSLLKHLHRLGVAK